MKPNYPTFRFFTPAMVAVLMVIPALLMVSLATAADSPGNELNPDGLAFETGHSPLGLNIFNPRNARSPAGLLYPPVMNSPGFTEAAETGWLYRGVLEAGYLGNSGTTDTGSFLEYGDLSEGFMLRGLGYEAIKPEEGKYFRLVSGAVGRDDSYYHVEGGQYGKMKLGAFFSSTPHTFSTNSRSLYDGIGTGVLALPAGIQAGESTAEDVRNYLNARPPRKLALQRDKSGALFTFDLNRQLQFHGQISSESREGTRAFGGTFSYPQVGQVIETIEPIDHQTTEVITGFRYVRDRLQGNLSYTGSFFRNEFESLTFENPGIPTFAGVYFPPQGQFALAPDNTFHSIRGDLATRFDPWSGRFNATVAYSVASQDEKLLPPTTATGIGGSSSYPVNLDNWNTVNALSQARADARVNTLTAQARYAVRPTRNLGVQFEVRVRDEDNETDYRVFNPLTGEYGYPALDGGLGTVKIGLGGIYRPSVPGSRVRIANIPPAIDRAHGDVSFDYRLQYGTRLNLRLRHQETDYAHRERSRVEDDEIKLEVANSSLDNAILRMTYIHVDRSGTDYNPNPYEQFYSSSFADFQPRFADGQVPHTLSALRKYDLADKSGQTLRAQAHILLSDKSDLQLTGSISDDDFEADFGLRDSRSLTLNTEWTYQFNKESDAFLYYSYQDRRSDVSNINDAGPIGSDPAPGGAVYRLDAVWSQAAKEINHAAGGGYQRAIGALTFEASYTYSFARSELGYDYASPRAFNNAYTQEVAGNAYPDQTFELHMAEASLAWPIRDNFTLRFFYRYEREDLDDFHYQGLVDPVLAGTIYLQAVPEDFSAHLLGTYLKFDF
ncbi:MAG: MtrB/PioB family outer membrane beta-barrel protein [Pseudohongiellaceae bacterium]